jgi:hypothetical protein
MSDREDAGEHRSLGNVYSCTAKPATGFKVNHSSPIAQLIRQRRALIAYFDSAILGAFQTRSLGLSENIGTKMCPVARFGLDFQKVDQFQSLGTLAPRLSPIPIFPLEKTLPILDLFTAQLTVGVDGSPSCEPSLLLMLLAISQALKSRRQCSHARERMPLGW